MQFQSLTPEVPNGIQSQNAGFEAAFEVRRFARKVVNRLIGRHEDFRSRINRNSFDVDDRRAQVARRYGDGSKRGTGAWVRAYLRTAQEYDRHVRGQTGRSPLGASGVQVLEAILLNHWHDFKTGHIDPALSQLEAATGYARTTIVAILKRLRQHGFINWVRRTQHLDRQGQAGPQRCQVNNLYFLDVRNLPKEAAGRLQQLLAKVVSKATAAGANRPEGSVSNARSNAVTVTAEISDSLSALERALMKSERELHNRTVSEDQNISGD